MSNIPAIAVGGPPHSGKSVLIYSLTQALRDQGVPHYVLRACPDGEGDWSNEATPEMVQELRSKGKFTSEFVTKVRQAIRDRTLPLLVDVGGRPTEEQEGILAECSDIILLAPDESGLDEWRALATRNGLPVLAELHSSLTEPDAIYQETVLLRGRIHGLERHRRVRGPVLQRLAWLVRDLLAETHQQLPRLHLDAAPAELTVEVVRLLRAIAETPEADPAQHGRWYPHYLPATLAYLPAGEALAIYGRGPNWLYAALAAHAHPAPLHQFDARLGWVRPAPLRLATGVGDAAPPSPMAWTLTEQTAYQQVTAKIVDTYLPYAEAQELTVPRPMAHKGLVLSGKVPHWFLTGMVLTYWSHMVQLPFLATYQPQVGNIVVASRSSDVRPGTLVT